MSKLTDELRGAPSSLTDSAIRKFAKRRGFKVKKKRGHDWYYIVDEDGYTTVAFDHALTEEERYFSKVQLVDYLKGYDVIEDV